MDWFTSVVLVLCIFRVIPADSQKCSLVHNDHLVRCVNVLDFHLLVDQIQWNWNNIVINNMVPLSTHIPEPWDTINFNAIHSLDLSAVFELDLKPPFFTLFNAIMSLNLANSNITLVNGEWFDYNNHLRTLDLSRNRITNLNRDYFSNLARLQVLNLSENKISSIFPATFTGLKKLTELYINSNLLEHIEFGELSHLKSLWLANNYIYNISRDSLSRLEVLEELHLQDNQLQIIHPDGFQNLTYLRVLNFTNTDLQNVDLVYKTGLEQMEMQELDLSWNGLRTLNTNLWRRQLQHLQHLNLSHNSLRNSFRATTFYGFHYLKVLNLAHNNISTLPPNIFQALAKLEWLDMSNNNLTLLNGDIFGSAGQMMKHLDLSQNQLKQIDSNSFENMDTLSHLFLDHNLISYLPENVFQNNIQLKHLSVNDNALNELCRTQFTYLDQLEVLCLHHNQLTFFPTIKGLLPKLTIMNIDANPWQCKCLNELHESLGGHIQITSNNSKRSRPACADTSDFLCHRDMDWVKDVNFWYTFNADLRADQEAEPESAQLYAAQLLMMAPAAFPSLSDTLLGTLFF